MHESDVRLQDHQCPDWTAMMMHAWLRYTSGMRSLLKLEGRALVTQKAAMLSLISIPSKS